MSKFPNSGSSVNGNRLIEKIKVDNTLYIDNLASLGPDWGEAFVGVANSSFSGTPSQKYKIAHTYSIASPGGGGGRRLDFYQPGAASIGTDIYLCGSSSIRPSKYNIANDTWTEDGLAYNDYGSLDISVGGFGHDGSAYFYTNTPGMGTSVNFLEIKKYTPGTNTWTTLTPLSAGNAATVIYGFMGVADGAAYFMQMVKSSNPTYVPANFPCLYKYTFLSDSWTAIAVTPPLAVTGGATAGAGSPSGVLYVPLLRGSNSIGCKYSDTEFLIHVRSPMPDGGSYISFINTEEIYKFDTITNTFSLVCKFKHHVKEGLLPKTIAANADPSDYDERLFYYDGVVYLWSPKLGGLKAYSLSENKQYFVPMSSVVIDAPIICYESGRIFFLGGDISDQTGPAVNPLPNGLIIDLAGISAFLNKEKTIAINVKSFE